MYLIPMIPLVAVIMAKVQFSLFAYSGNKDCSGNGTVRANVGFSV